MQHILQSLQLSCNSVNQFYQFSCNLFRVKGNTSGAKHIYASLILNLEFQTYHSLCSYDINHVQILGTLFNAATNKTSWNLLHLGTKTLYTLSVSLCKKSGGSQQLCSIFHMKRSKSHFLLLKFPLQFSLKTPLYFLCSHSKLS